MLKRPIALMCSAVIIFGLLASVALASEKQEGVTALTEDSTALERLLADARPQSSSVQYTDYLAQYAKAQKPETQIEIAAADYSAQYDNSNVKVEAYKGEENALIWDSQQGAVEWKFNAQQDGLYAMSLDYCPVQGKSNDIQLQMSIDGGIPYKNAEVLRLARSFTNETNVFKTDSRGNQVRPRQTEIFEWQTKTITDGDGQYRGELYFYLSKGEHTLRFDMLLEKIALKSIRFHQVEKPITYEQALSEWSASGKADASGFSQKYEAEFTALKNDSVLFPTYDKSRVTISPSSPNEVRYNTLGKDTWKAVGQAVSWEIEVPQDGYYQIAFKAKQNAKRGMYSTRALYVDDNLLFEELGNIQFKNNTSWYMQTVGGDKPYKIYLTAGKHTLKMEAVLGDEEEMLRTAESLVAQMNEWYRKIIVITGSNADSSRVTIDLNRDFLLDKKIPGLMQGFESISKELESCIALSNEIYGDKGNSGTVMSELKLLLDKLVKRPDKIAKNLESFRSSVSTMATWVLDMRDQPLELDYFVIYSADMATPEIGGNIFSQIAFRTKAFLYSFDKEYNSLGDTYENNVIDVWVSTSDLATTGIASGRDQAQVIKTMIDDMFTPKTGISVNVSLVNSSTTLVQAVLANKGPDAALVVSKDTPVNLAMRNALVPLENFDGFSEITQRFMPSAMVPYQFEGKTYALPETQSYDVLFYRKDIFNELGLTVPKTWDEFYYTVAVLQQNNLLTGIQENQKTFESLLYQRGARFYNDELSKTEFDKAQALSAFEQWTGLYSKYSLPLKFDFFNRFRSGEMPMAIMPYTQCNYLEAAAPELRNLWDFEPIPGTPQTDKSINHAETAAGTACIILQKSESHEQSFEFLSWWTSAETQARFGNELENLMGAAARYPTANVEAFESLPWGNKQAESLMQQWNDVVEIPQIPGNYYINRNISFAFRAVVYNYANERETLYKYNKEINKEIKRKRQEFSLGSAASD